MEQKVTELLSWKLKLNDLVKKFNEELEKEKNGEYSANPKEYLGQIMVHYFGKENLEKMWFLPIMIRLYQVDESCEFKFEEDGMHFSRKGEDFEAECFLSNNCKTEPYGYFGVDSYGEVKGISKLVPEVISKFSEDGDKYHTHLETRIDPEFGEIFIRYVEGQLSKYDKYMKNSSAFANSWHDIRKTSSDSKLKKHFSLGEDSDVYMFQIEMKSLDELKTKDEPNEDNKKTM